MNKKNIKEYMFLIVFAIVCYWLINNFYVITNIIFKMIKVLSPFIIGCAIAFILNIPMKKIENFLERKIKNKKIPIRTISIILALLIFVSIIVFIAFLLLPELISSIETLINSIPSLISNTEKSIIDLLNNYPDIQKELINIFNETSNISSILSTILNHFVNGALNFIGSIFSSLITLFTSIIFAIYILSQKEYLKLTFIKLMRAYIKKEYISKITNAFKIADKTFSSFITGQCMDAAILGIIFFIVLSIFKFPYALIISVLTAITALIPIFGAMIAMIIGAILIAITNPIQALIFIVVFQIIQQIEGNFIYPRVVGKSVGLSPMWTLLAITVGGNLYGIIGMLLGLPLASMIYALIKNDVNKRLENKE